MSPGFRYHVATLTAVFLALGVGIIMGSTFVSSVIVDRQARTLASLRDQFTKEIQPRREEIGQYANFVSSLHPWLIEGKLAGKHVALIQTGDYPDTTRGIRETLESAGATTCTTTLDRGFVTRADANLKTLLPLLRAVNVDLPQDISATFSTLARAITNGAPAGLKPLEDARLLRTDGDFSKPADYIVLVGGASLENESRAETLDAPLLKILSERAVPIVVAEPKAAAISYLPVLRTADFSTVDNADTDIGRISVVLALQSDRGHFGVKPTASSILPSPPSTNGLGNRPGP